MAEAFTTQSCYPRYCLKSNLVWLTHIKEAGKKLEPGLMITIDGKELFVYEGTI